MERNHSYHPRVLYQVFHDHLSRIQKGSFKAKPDLETIRIARGLTLLFFAIGLAWTSSELTQKQSIFSYRSNYWPQSLVWEQALERQGLKRRSDLNLYGKLLESHPAPFADDSSIWASNDFCAVYLSKSPYQQGAELWTCDENQKSSGWTKLGTGLIGFETLSDQLQEMPKKTILAQKLRAKSVDPKEFHY